MNFGELILLFLNNIDKIKEDSKEKNPSLKFIIIAYNNVVKKINEMYPVDETCKDVKINALDITENMKEKLIKISKQKVTKELKLRQKNLKLKQELNALLGIGDKKVDELIESGLTSVKQLSQKKYFNTLNIDTQMTITHSPIRLIDIKEINKIEHRLTKFNNFIKLVGSYRRKKPFIRDIDILFLANNIPKNTIENYIIYLKKEFNNEIYFYSNGEHKMSMIFQPDVLKPDIKYKADIFITNKENYYSTLLYTTGSKFNNIKMRARAKRLGYLLNQNGIFDKNNKKINKSTDDERKLFQLLDLPYLEPEQRF